MALYTDKIDLAERIAASRAAEEAPPSIEEVASAIHRLADVEAWQQRAKDVLRLGRKVAALAILQDVPDAMQIVKSTPPRRAQFGKRRSAPSTLHISGGWPIIADATPSTRMAEAPDQANPLLARLRGASLLPGAILVYEISSQEMPLAHPAADVIDLGHLRSGEIFALRPELAHDASRKGFVDNFLSYGDGGLAGNSGLDGIETGILRFAEEHHLAD